MKWTNEVINALQCLQNMTAIDALLDGKIAGQVP